MAQPKTSGRSMGERIDAALDGRTQKWLSARSGVARQTLSNAIAHDAMLSADKAILVARALKVTVEWLVLGEGTGPAPMAAAPAAEDADDVTSMLAQRMRPAVPGGRMRWPSWFHDAPVLNAVFRSHRKANLDCVIADLDEKFGTRAPSRSSLARFWLRLDEMFAEQQGTN